MPGRAIINAGTVFALGLIAALLARCRAGKPGSQNPRQTWAWGSRDIAAITSVLVLIAAAYWRAAHIPFLSDDYVLVRMAQLFSGNYGTIFTRGGGDGFFRPLGYISIGWSWPWAKLDALRWHVLALTIHALNTVLVYFLARTMSLSRAWAWFASALFAVDAAHPEAVTWIAGRFDLLATALVLVGLIAFIRFWEGDGFLWCAAAAIAMTAGILSKESAYALPLMMLVYTCSRPDFRKRSVRMLAPFFILAAILFAYRWTLQGGIGGYPQMFAPHPVSLANALLLRSWAILFFPVNWTTGVGAGLSIATILYGAAWMALPWSPAGARSQLLVPLGLALAAAIPPVGQLLLGADLEKSRLLYLPSVGFCLFAASATGMAAPRIRTMAALAMLAFQFIALRHNLGTWEDIAAKSKTVCEAATACSNPNDVTGLPRSIDGVYFFANGFPECVRFQQASHPEIALHTCSLAWDPRTQELRERK